MEVIEKILSKIQCDGYFNIVKRYEYLPYNINLAMRVVEAIGKKRNQNFVIDNENRFTYENLVRWVHGDRSMMCLDPETKQPVPGRLDKGIYIAGNTGTGKSWALDIMAVYSTIDKVKYHLEQTTMVRRSFICFAGRMCELIRFAKSSVVMAPLISTRNRKYLVYRTWGQNRSKAFTWVTV